MRPAAAVMAWVEEVVVGYGLCPFAAQPLRRGQVTAREIDAPDVPAAFEAAMTQVQSFLAEEPTAVVTTLLVFSRALPDFLTFLDFVATLEDVLAETGADQLLQLAHFHPDYQFADLSFEDAANRTNRAPFPVVQLLRVAGVARAIEQYPDVEDIPERNIRKMREVFGAE